MKIILPTIWLVIRLISANTKLECVMKKLFGQVVVNDDLRRGLQDYFDE